MESTGLLIDSGIFIDHLRAKNKERSALSIIPNVYTLYISVVTLYELSIGATTLEKQAVFPGIQHPIYGFFKSL